jgi:hypothetical protein
MYSFIQTQVAFLNANVNAIIHVYSRVNANAKSSGSLRLRTCATSSFWKMNETQETWQKWFQLRLYGKNI